MKKYLIAILSTALLAACGSPGNNKEETVTGKQEEHPEHTTGLTLNNGIKWKADPATNANVAGLKTIITSAKTEKPVYPKIADQLQQGLNKIIAECKMKGPDHEALHKWLEPLIEKTKALKNETNTETAGAVFKEIENHINLYTQYFE